MKDHAHRDNFCSQRRAHLPLGWLPRSHGAHQLDSVSQGMGGEPPTTSRSKKATGRSHKSPVSPQSTSEPGHWLPGEGPTSKSLRLEDSLPRFLPAAEAKPPGAHQEGPHLPASPALPRQEPQDKGGHPRFITSGACTDLKANCF